MQRCRLGVVVEFPHPTVAHKYAAVVATGRSDFPNQINNVLAFPGLFRGALDSGAHGVRCPGNS